MDRELAQIVLTSAFRARVELGYLMPLIKNHGVPSDDDAIRLAIASAVYEIGLIADRVFEQHFDLKEETEARFKKYGRSSY
jgi:hypothetical protein